MVLSMSEYILVLILCSALLFIIVAIGSLTKAKKIRKEYHIQKGEITYSDLDKPARPLYSRRYNLSGKPDYIVKNEDGYIPVEVKHTPAGYPYFGHMMQLACYCLLLEDAGRNVPFGVIVYKNDQFRISFNESLRSDLIRLIDTMRKEIMSGKIRLNHDQPGRCIKCSLKKYCTRKLI
jgi:CRISPR-associated exonuclease Cas4